MRAIVLGAALTVLSQLAWKIRNDPRVTSREQFNLRHLKPADVPETV